MARKKKSKFVGLVLSSRFRKEGKLIPQGSVYDAIDKGSFEYLVTTGVIEPLKK